MDLQKSGSRILRLTPKKILDVGFGGNFQDPSHLARFLGIRKTLPRWVLVVSADGDGSVRPSIRSPGSDSQTNRRWWMGCICTVVRGCGVFRGYGSHSFRLQDGGYSAPRKGKKNDQAHPPIHPIAHAGNLTGDAKRVYEFVTRRYLACCSKDAEGFETTIDISAGGEDFYATGKLSFNEEDWPNTLVGLIVLARNYLDVYPYDKWGDRHIPNFNEGQTFMPTVCELRDGKTSRPNLLTEADLVGLMDKNGIGKTNHPLARELASSVSRYRRNDRPTHTDYHRSRVRHISQGG